jgi:hypothetical protein
MGGKRSTLERSNGLSVRPTSPGRGGYCRNVEYRAGQSSGSHDLKEGSLGKFVLDRSDPPRTRPSMFPLWRRRSSKSSP